MASTHQNSPWTCFAMLGGAAISLALVLSGCGSSEASESSTLRLMVAAGQGVSLQIAEEEWTDIAARWSAASGGEISPSVVPSHEVASELFGAGQGDVCRLPAHLAARHVRSGFAEIVGIATRNGSAWGTVRLIVAQDSPASSLPDLRGGGLAVASGDLVQALPGALILFDSANMNLVNDLARIVPSRSLAAVRTMLRRGGADAALVYSPDGSPHWETIFPPTDFRVLGEPLNIPHDLLLARKGLLNQNACSSLLASLATVIAEPPPPGGKALAAWAGFDAFLPPSSVPHLNDALKPLARFRPEQLSALEEFAGP